MNSKPEMSFLIENFFNTEAGPVFSLDVSRGLQDNQVSVCAIVSELAENLEDWKTAYAPNCLFIWKVYKNRYLETLLNGIKIRFKFRKRHFNFALYPNPVKRNLIVEKFVKVRENIMILHDVVRHSGEKEGFGSYVFGIVRQADNILVMSRLFIPIVEEQFNKSKHNILYMRHGTMNYPEYTGSFSGDESKGSINFLFFGRIEKYKGLHVLSKAFKEVQKQYPDVNLTVAGSGDFSEYEEEYAALDNTVVMNKYITDDEIAYLFSKPNTVIVMPYIDATQSGITGMAYNYETPIISTDTGGLREQLFDGEVGVFAKPGDADDLAEKMIRFLAEPDLFAEQKVLMKESKEKMSWKYITNELMEQLESHIEN